MLRVILVAPRFAAGGVGDYAADLREALLNAGVRVDAVLTGGAGGDTLASTHAARRQVEALVAEKSLHPVIVHCELSAASIAPFWALRGHHAITTATLHDPPHAAWWPLNTRWLARHRLALHAIHYPVRHVWWRFERASLAATHLFVLSQKAAAFLTRDNQDVTYVPHYVPERPDICPAHHRPQAIGLFGYRYGGKGYDTIGALRSAVARDLDIHVAGRGTDDLRTVEGVTVWGAVEKEHEREFFSAVRCIVLPYETGGRYGPFLSTSGVIARAYAYRTPVVATDVRAFQEEEQYGALQICRGGTGNLGRTAARLASDPSELSQRSAAADQLRMARRPAMIASQFIAAWQDLVERNG